MNNIATKLGLILGGLLVAGQVDAANSNAMTISAASFQDYFNNGSFCMNGLNYGMNNQCSSDTQFIYGIPKGPSTAGYTVTLEGFHNVANVQTNFTVFSHTHDGTLLASLFNSATTSGHWSKAVTFSAAQAPASARLTTIVTLPASFNGQLYGLTLAY